MREMKDSGFEYIGNIPIDWKLDRIKNQLKFFEARNPGEKIVLSLYREHGIVPKDSRDDNYNVTSADTSNYRFVRCGDFVINKMKAWQGSLAVSEYEGIVSPAYYVYEFRTEDMERKYLHYLLRSKYYAEEFRKLSGGIRIGQWDLSRISFENTKIIVPAIEEQRKIVECLDKKCTQIDALIANVQAQIEKLKQYKQSIITEVVTKGLDSTVPMKDSGVEWIGKIPDTWEVKPLLREIETVVDYRGKTPEKVDEGILLVTARNIKDGKIDYSISREYVRTEEYDEIMHRGKLNIGDVLFTTEAPLGAVANVDRTDFALAQRIIKFTTKSSLNPYYLKYWMLSTSFQHHLKSYATGSTATGIKASKLCLLQLVQPPLLIQNEIVCELNRKSAKIERLITIKHEKIDKLNEYKKSLIYEYVTGKKEA